MSTVSHTITATATSATGGSARELRRVGARIRQRCEAYRRRLHERAARRELLALDDRLLHDIGLSRADINRDFSELAAERELRRAAIYDTFPRSWGGVGR